MKKRIFLLALLISATRAPAHSEFGQQLCAGVAPENDMYIPVSEVQAQGINKTKFDEILNRIYRLYANEVARRGARLVVQNKWNDGKVNAYAFQSFGNWYIAMYGGMARHSAMTYDGFAAVACHEMGHHLGGAPTTDWASNEGQSDYYATNKCLKRLFEKDDNDTILAGMRLDPTAVRICQSEHRSKQDEQLCIRATMAGMSLGNVLASLESSGLPSLTRPDPRQVSRTNHAHPRAQCRLDTYFQGSLCRAGHWQNVSASDYRIGYCADPTTYTRGLRPRCWFKPN